MNQPILLYRSGSVYANETAAWAALDAVTHKKGQPIIAFYTLSSPVSGHHGSSTIGAIFAIGIGDGVGQYKACTSHDDMLIVAQSLNAHITQFNQMFEYDANHNAIKAKLDFYTTDGKSISAGGIGSGSSASLGALYQLVDVMANSSNTGVEGAVEGSVLAYDATAGKWKAIAQSEILPDMSGYYTKDETDSAINTAKSNLQGQVDTLKALIPATASADNQLADKDFVNSSIATATAEFRGSFTSLDELKATSGNLNDYAFYLHTDDVGNSIVDRYKWTTAGWLYEYTLNNSSFTAEQWAALNSAITATLVQSYNSHLTNSTIHITAAERTAWNNKWDYNEETIKAVKVKNALNADYVPWSGVTNRATTLSGYGITDAYTSTTIDSKLSGYLPLTGGTMTGSIIVGIYTSFGVSGDIFYLGNPSYPVAIRSNGTTTINDNTLIHSGNIGSYNAGSATKLATARKIWGQSFDGSTDVSGDLIDVGNITASGKATIQGDIVCGGEVVAVAGEGTPAGVTDYSALTGKPAINGVTLVSGNNTLAALGIQAAGDYATNSGVTTLLANYADKTFVSNNYVGKSAFNAHTADTDIHITASERIAWNAKWDYNEATIKAVKVTSASSADSVAWSGISGKPSTFTPSAHTHNASEISGLPTKLSAFTNDVGYITGITKSMVEGVLTGDITSHTHSQYLTSALRPAKLFSNDNNVNGYYKIKINSPIEWMLSFDVKIYQGYRSYTIRFSGYNYNTRYWYAPAASLLDGDNTIDVKFGYDAVFELWIAIPAHEYAGINITNIANGYYQIDTYALDQLFTITRVAELSGTTQQTITLYPPSKADHTHTFASLTSKPTTLSGYGITDAYTSSTIDGKLAGYLPLTGGTMTGSIIVGIYTSFGVSGDIFYLGNPSYPVAIRSNGTTTINDNTLIHSGNYNSYAPTLTGTGASGTWGIDITGNAFSATKLQTPRTIWGQSFDGSGDVSGNLILGYNKIYLLNGNDNHCISWDTNGKLVIHNYYDVIFETYYSISFYTYAQERLRITSGGNVLIGTTTDNGYKLQVNGSERVYGDLIVDGEVSALVA